MLTSIMASLGAAIGGQVIKYMKEHRKEQQLEIMQGEILEGWVYKIQIAVRDEHRKGGVPLETHKKVMDKIAEVVREEFDTTKI